MNQKVLLIIVFVAVTAFVGWQYFTPALNKALAAREELAVWQDKLDNARGLSNKLAELEKKYNAMLDQAKRVEQAVPPKQDIPGLLVQFDNLASQNGLILSGITFAAVEADAKAKSTGAGRRGGGAGTAEAAISGANDKTAAGGAKTLWADLSLNGSQSALKNFLLALENNLRLMDVVSINFAGSGASAGAGQEISVSLNVYYRD